jgi:hypothetical protein
MKNFLLFRKMISPMLIQVLFWISVLVFLFIAIIDLIHEMNFLFAFEILILGPLISRIICETLILFFRIYDRLTQIKMLLEEKK